MTKVKKTKLQKTEEVCDEAEVSSDDPGYDEESAEDIDVEFEAFGICEKDVDGIVKLLKQAFLKEDIDVGEIANLLANQDGRGCIFMTHLEDDDENSSSAETSRKSPTEEIDDEIYGVVSFLDLNEYAGRKCVQQIRNMLQKYNATCDNEETRQKIDNFLQSLESKGSKKKRTALIINERLSNLPYHIALPAFQALSKEIEGSNQNYDQFLLISKLNKTDNAAPSSNLRKSTGKKRKKSRKIAIDESDNPGVIFINAEEEFLSDECRVQMDYKLECGDESSIQSFRRLLIFDRLIFNRFLQKLAADIASHCE